MKFTKLLVILPVLFSMGCQPQDVDALKAEAKNFMANSQNGEALITLKSALGIDPKDDELRAMSAIVNYNLGDYVSVVSMVERIQQHESLAPSYRKSIEELYVLANYQLENYEVVLKNLDSDLDQNKAAIKYLSLLQTRKPIAAKSFASSYISSNSQPDNFRSFYEALSKSQEDAELIDIISILEPIDDQFSEKWLLLGKLYFANGSFVEAENSFKAYLENYPGNRRVKIYLANAKVQNSSYEESLEILANLVKDTGNAPVIDQMFAEVAFKAKQYNKAKIHTDKAIAAGFKSPIIDYISAISSFYLGLYEQSFDSLQSIPNIVSKNQTLRNLEMLLLIRLGYELDTINSRGMVERGLGENIAISLLLEGQRAKASAVLAKTEPLSGEQLDVRQTLERAALEMGLGEKDKVAELSNAALDLDPSNLEARLLQAYNNISAGEYDDAIVAIERGLKIDSRYTPLLELAVKVSLMQKNTVKADEYSNALSDIDEANETVLLYKVSKLIAEKKVKEALKEIEKHSESKAFTTKVAETYFVLTQETKTWQNFISVVNKDLHKTNDDVSLMLARAYVANEQVNEARSILDKFPFKNNRYFESLVEFAYASNDVSLLRRTLEEWTSRNDASVTAFLTYVQFLDSTGSVKEAVRVAQKGIEKFKDSKRLHYVYSEMMLLAGRTDAAIDVLLSRLVKDEPLAQILLSKAEGIKLLSNGNVELAFTKLFKYYESSRSKEKTSTLITTIEKISGTKDAINFISLITEKHPEDLLALRYYADAHIYTEPGKAIHHYEMIVAKDKGNVEVLNNLAWLLSKQEKFDIALSYAVRAYELAPKNVSVRTTLATILLELEKYSEAKDVLASMIFEDKLMSLDAMLDYADALVGLSEKSEAVDFLHTMSKKDFPTDIKNALLKHLTIIENN